MELEIIQPSIQMIVKYGTNVDHSIEKTDQLYKLFYQEIIIFNLEHIHNKCLVFKKSIS